MTNTIGDAAARSLAAAVASLHRAEEKRLLYIRSRLLRALAAHQREAEREGNKENTRYWMTGDWPAIHEKLVKALDCVEQCISDHWKHERRAEPTGNAALEELISTASRATQARASKRYLAQRAKANERGRRYRVRRRAAKAAANPTNVVDLASKRA
jgi:hypothetical protein